MIEWLNENRDWLFSGIGVSALAVLVCTGRWFWFNRESGFHRRLFFVTISVSPIFALLLHYLFYQGFWYTSVGAIRLHFLILPFFSILLTSTFAYWLVGFRVRQLRKELYEIRLSDNFQDPLTKIPNIKALEHTFIEKQNLARHTNYPLSVLLLDVDNFKRINDQYGMDAGDTVLSQLVTLLKDNIRGAEDAIIRYKIGDEFFITCYRATGLNAKDAVGHRLRRYVQENEFQVPPIDEKDKGGHIEHLTISVGVTEVKSFKDDLKAVQDRVEKALRQAKQKKNDVVLV